MELASIELTTIIHALKKIVSKYYVSNIYLVDDDTILIKLHHSEHGDKRLVVSSGRGIWLTRYDLDKENVQRIIPILRKKLSKGRFEGAEQPAGERIVILRFETAEGTHKLIGEFFSHGNIILVNQDDRVLASLKTLKVRHREIRPGSKYTLPPTRGIDASSASMETFNQIANSSIEISRWLARNLSISRKYIEETLDRAGVDRETKGNNLNQDDIERIYNKLKEVTHLTTSGEEESSIIYDGDNLVDATPFHFNTYSHFQSKQVPSFMEAVDEVLSKEIVSRKQGKSQDSIRRKLTEFEESLRKQSAIREETANRAIRLREVASSLKASALVDFGGLKDIVREFDGVEIEVSRESIALKIEGGVFEVSKQDSVFTLASKLFDESKRLEKRVQLIEIAKLSLSTRRDEILKDMEKSEENTDEVKTVTSREKSWYEKYRWFITSENLLAVGGRDSFTNTALIKRHAERGDLVFHADVHGSPYFLLKKSSPDMEISISETAQAVVGFSRAWREGLSSANSYWINLDQVKSQAPSGMYMPKGSFMIEGKRNYIRNIEMKIGVGISFRENEHIVTSGHPDAVKKHSLACAVLVPDRQKVTEAAKKMKKAFVRYLGKEYAKKIKGIPLDDIIRVMPSGGAKITTYFAGDQKHRETSHRSIK